MRIWLLAAHIDHGTLEIQHTVGGLCANGARHLTGRVKGQRSGGAGYGQATKGKISGF